MSAIQLNAAVNLAGTAVWLGRIKLGCLFANIFPSFPVLYKVNYNA